MKYMITKEECQKAISGVCSRCGGELHPIETVDNADNPTFWCGCESCCHFDNGVSPLVFRIAEALTESGNYPYHHNLPQRTDDEELKKYRISSQNSGNCSIVLQVLNLLEKMKD